MNESDSEPMTTTITTTFRFASGQVLALDENQIEQIPYLSAVVSSADRFQSARDEDGYFKLDPHISYEHFSFVLQSLSFHSVRQLFTCLPIQNDIIPLIALLDFLGLGPQPDPTLKEVDSTFFSNVVYSPFLGKNLQIVRPCVLQEMAARFAIVMAKEEYDCTKCEVVDQIYWFIMFILSAPKWFGSRLRHHVYTIAEHCFSLFKPSLLKPLKKLRHRTKEETRKSFLTIEEQEVAFDEENISPLEQTLDLNSDDSDWPDTHYLFRYRRTLAERNKLLSHRIYERDHLSWFQEMFDEQDPLELVYRRVLEIMYEVLQNVIHQGAIAELREEKNANEFVQERIFFLICFDYSAREVLPKRIGNIFIDEVVQENIRALILEELCILSPKLEQRHAKLVKEIREYEQRNEISDEDSSFCTISLFHYGYFPIKQRRASSLMLLLDKLHQNSDIIVEEIQQRVLAGLRDAALTQFNHWKHTQRVIDGLNLKLNACEQSEKSPCIVSKTVRQRYQTPVHKPFLKRQFKYSTR